MALKMEIKAENDTLGPGRTFLTLLIFGSYPIVGIEGDIAASPTVKTAKLMKKAGTNF